MKKSLSLILTVLILLLGCLPTAVTAYAEDETTEDELPKKYFHFYTGNEKYENVPVDDTALYAEAFSYMRKRQKTLTCEDKTIWVTVAFTDQFASTQEYADYVEKRKFVQTCEEADALLRDSLKAFHDARTPENLELLKGFEIEELAVIDYSPFVRFRIRIENTNEEAFYNLILQRKVAYVCFSFEYQFYSPGVVVEFPEPIADEPEPIADEPEPIADEPEPAGFFENVWNNILSFFARIGDFFASLFK